jgi:hypothetical protein
LADNYSVYCSLFASGKIDTSGSSRILLWMMPQVAQFLSRVALGEQQGIKAELTRLREVLVRPSAWPHGKDCCESALDFSIVLQVKRQHHADSGLRP